MIVYDYTPLIRMSDGKYPAYLQDFRIENPYTSIGTWMYSENLVEYGYFPVIPTEMPSGDVVTEGAPHFNDETQEWEQTWNVREFTQEEIAANLLSAKNEKKSQAQNVLNNDLNIGIPYPYDGTSYKVRVKGFDLATILTIKNVLDNDSDQSTEVYPFRFIDGYKADFTYAEMSSLISEVSHTHYELMKRYWEYLDDVEKTTSIENLPDLPESFL